MDDLGLLALLDEALGVASVPGLTPYDNGGVGADGGAADDPPAARSTAPRARPRSSRRSLSRASRLLSPRGLLGAPFDSTTGVGVGADALQQPPPPAAAARVEARLQAYERQWAAFRRAQAAAQGRPPGALVVSRADGWRDTQAVRGRSCVRRGAAPVCDLCELRSITNRTAPPYPTAPTPTAEA